MKAQEIKLQKTGYNFNANCFPRGSHVSLLLSIGRCFPTCKSQAIKWQSFDVLNYEDVQIIENLLNKHGFIGNYKETKSGNWVRLVNQNDFKLALKKEYNF
jgi:hypothetical protein